MDREKETRKIDRDRGKEKMSTYGINSQKKRKLYQNQGIEIDTHIYTETYIET
jgi:hypothetical protein